MKEKSAGGDRMVKPSPEPPREIEVRGRGEYTDN